MHGSRSRHRRDGDGRPRRAALRLPLALTVALVGTALAGTLPASASSETDEASLRPMVVGLGFRPSVQFAQFYLADQAGYYREAGLAVELRYLSDPDIMTLLAQGALDIGTADGTSLIAAVSQGIPVRYGATLYARFPNVVFALADRGISGPADLAGRRLGTPGRFGSSWIMLQALLASEGLAVDDVEIVAYPDFGQGAAVAAGQVDAATGFAANEPVQLRLQGLEVDVIRVDDIMPLPGPGLAAGESTLAARGDDLRAFTAATLRAMEDIIADPQQGLDATFAVVPELASDPATQEAILLATTEAWQSPWTEARGLGVIDRGAWERALDFMVGLPDSPVAGPVSLDDLLTDDLLTDDLLP
jgi:NitT/TauT family transport system substrate-binding protein